MKSNTSKQNDACTDFIANPYILDEQYSGAVPTPVTTASLAGTPSKEAPFVPSIFAVGMLMLAWRWRRERS